MIDFLTSKMRHRCQQASLRKELLAKAMGISPQKHPRIIDATAGWGRDAFILAYLGFEIIALERSNAVYTLLADALKRVKENGPEALRRAAERVQLLHADACAYLPACNPPPDIVYLDPMFPIRQKSAAVKKEMVILQELVGQDADTDRLFAEALACARQRVVVKRPRLANPLMDCPPHFTLNGRSSRFDVYLTKR